MLAASPLAGAWFFSPYREASTSVSPAAPAEAASDDASTKRRYVVEATGQDYRWRFRYVAPAGAENAPSHTSNADSQVLRIPLGATVELHLRSEDYIYLLSIPELGVREIAAPGLVHTAEFAAERPLRRDLEADALCNFRFYHDDFMGRIVIQ
ncbi:MAG: hypothetical protein KY475_22950 [Planctomycetes bacterium]|nr:hypothetical protein [Planctomycetota bacterium]